MYIHRFKYSGTQFWCSQGCGSEDLAYSLLLGPAGAPLTQPKYWSQLGQGAGELVFSGCGAEWMLETSS